MSIQFLRQNISDIYFLLTFHFELKKFSVFSAHMHIVLKLGLNGREKYDIF